MEWRMPDLGEGVQEGEILKWLVKEGDSITIDQHLVEIMTDKATMEIPSSIEGKLQKIVLKEGSVAKIGQTLAIIGEGAVIGEGKSEAKKEELPEPKKEREAPIARKEPRGEGKALLAAPAVRQLARDLGVDLTRVMGMGPAGRITKEDVEHAAGKKPTTERAAIPYVAFGNETRQPLRGLRRKIAEHMVLSRRSAAHFTHVDEVDLTELVALRDSAKQSAATKGIKLTFLPYILKAVIEGLKKFPQMNASLDEERQEVVFKKYYNIGIAVATEEGLIVPVVKNADKLSLWDLAREINRLGELARNQKIALDDLKGGTLTVTNIGSIGGIMSAPIINYPEVAIMGLHQIKPRVVVKDGEIAIRNMMYITISADHRVVDGADVAAFLKEVIGYLEKPEKFFK